MVCILLEPNVCVSCCHREDSNWAPRSVVITEGVPNLEIHPSINACATVAAVATIWNGHSLGPSCKMINTREYVGVAFRWC